MAEAARIRLLWKPQAQFAGYLLAAEGATDGPALAWQAARSDEGPIDAVLEGNAEFAVASPSHIAESRAPDALCWLLTVQQESALVYPCWPDAGIARPADLRGRRIAVWPGGEDLELLWMLARDGVAPGEVERLPAGDTVGPFLDREVDCAQMTLYHELHKAQALAPAAVRFHELRAADLEASLIKDGLVARRDWVERNPGLTQAVVEAVLAGWIRAFDEPASALAACLRARPDMPEAEQASQLADIRGLSLVGATLTRGLGFPDPLHMQRAAAAAAAVGLPVAAEVLADAVEPRFWAAAPQALRRTAW